MKIIFSLILTCLTYVANSQLDGSYQNLVNRPEAKGLDVSIYVPDGWFISAEREDGPISLSNSTGSDVIFITIKRLPTFYSRRMSNEIFRGEEYVQTLIRVFQIAVQHLHREYHLTVFLKRKFDGFL
jgi:hypothetical protein